MEHVRIGCFDLLDRARMVVRSGGTEKDFVSLAFVLQEHEWKMELRHLRYFVAVVAASAALSRL